MHIVYLQITIKYNKHFGRIDSNEFKSDELLDLLNGAVSNARSIDSKKKTEKDLKYCIDKINKAIDLINRSYKE